MRHLPPKRGLAFRDLDLFCWPSIRPHLLWHPASDWSQEVGAGTLEGLEKACPSRLESGLLVSGSEYRQPWRLKPQVGIMGEGSTAPSHQPPAQAIICTVPALWGNCLDKGSTGVPAGALASLFRGPCSRIKGALTRPCPQPPLTGSPLAPLL